MGMCMFCISLNFSNTLTKPPHWAFLSPTPPGAAPPGELRLASLLAAFTSYSSPAEERVPLVAGWEMDFDLRFSS